MFLKSVVFSPKKPELGVVGRGKRRPQGELPGPAGGAGKLERDSWSVMGGQDNSF